MTLFSFSIAKPSSDSLFKSHLFFSTHLEGHLLTVNTQPRKTLDISNLRHRSREGFRHDDCLQNGEELVSRNDRFAVKARALDNRFWTDRWLMCSCFQRTRRSLGSGRRDSTARKRIPHFKCHLEDGKKVLFLGVQAILL